MVHRGLTLQPPANTYRPVTGLSLRKCPQDGIPGRGTNRTLPRGRFGATTAAGFLLQHSRPALRVRSHAFAGPARSTGISSLTLRVQLHLHFPLVAYAASNHPEPLRDTNTEGAPKP